MIKGTFSIAVIIKCFAANIGFLLVFLSLKINAQPPQALAYSYINTFAKEAVDQMLEYKIPASVTLAQAIFESGCGNSALAKRSNNHFGIKCHTQWGGDTIRKSDDDYDECFRKYTTVKESYADHSHFLTSRDRYNSLFKLKVTDYRGWCRGLKKYGYATYAYYPEVLIKIIEEYRLYEYDGVEDLNRVNLTENRKQEIVPSKMINGIFTAEELCGNNILWNDERDFLIQSLDMVIEKPEIKKIISAKNNTQLCSLDIIESKLSPAGFTAKDFSKSDLLWTDAKDVLIQSLDMIIENPKKQLDLFVEK